MSPDLLDGHAALIVLGGTALATLLRSGWRETSITLKSLASLGHPQFHAEEARAELARQVEAIKADGLLRAPPVSVADREFGEVTDALLHRRSIPALIEAHEKHKARRMGEAISAVRTLAQASELAPVFGMVGTLVALNRMGSAPIGEAIGLAVITTLYGILAANLILAPLARLVERRARWEEGERQELVDWLASQISDVCQPVKRRKVAA